MRDTVRGSKLVLILALAAVTSMVAAACAGAAAPGYLTFDDQSVEGSSSESGPFATAAPAPAEALGGQRLAIRDGAKIVRTGSLALQVDDVAAALRAGRASIDALGGYIGASRESNHDDQPTAMITYRIPVERWDDALAALRGHALKVVEENTDALEVTDQLVDLAARIRNLKASEEALIAIQVKADKIADVLEVQRRLTDVRGEIEQLEAQRTGIEDRVAFATLDVSYGVEIAAVREIAKGFSPNVEVDRASAQLIGVLQSVVAAGIWFGIVWLPILIVLLVVVFVGIRVARRMGIRLPARNRSAGWGGGPGTPTAPPSG